MRPLALPLLLSLAACASLAALPLRVDSLDAALRKHATQADIKAEWGAPDSQVALDNGKVLWSYDLCAPDKLPPEEREFGRLIRRSPDQAACARYVLEFDGAGNLLQARRNGETVSDLRANFSQARTHLGLNTAPSVRTSTGAYLPGDDWR